MAHVNPKDIDPAVVGIAAAADGSAAAARPAKAPLVPKPVIPVSALVVINSGDAAAPQLLLNWSTHCAVSTSNGKFVSLPRATAVQIPDVKALPENEIAPFEGSAAVLIALHHWIEKFGTGPGTTTFSKVVTHSDMSTLVDEWEKDFHDRLLTREHETLFGVIQFAERHNLAHLLEFCVVALSCSLRGKGAEEMMAAMCVSGDPITAEELAAVDSAYPWMAAATKPT